MRLNNGTYNFRQAVFGALGLPLAVRSKEEARRFLRSRNVNDSTIHVGHRVRRVLETCKENNCSNRNSQVLREPFRDSRKSDNAHTILLEQLLPF